MRSPTLYVVLDQSGSMDEMAKIQVAINVLAFIRECQRLHLCAERWAFSGIRFVQWGESSTLADLPDLVEMPTPHARGRATIPNLITALDEELVNTNGRDLRLLLLSDGAFSNADARLLKDWVKRREVAPRAIAIGADAARSTLDGILGKNAVFLPQDVALALTGWDAAIDVGAGPLSIADIVMPSADDGNVSGNGGDDGWE